MPRRSQRPSTTHTAPVRLTAHERALLGLYRGLDRRRRLMVDVVLWGLWTTQDRGRPLAVRRREAILMAHVGALDARYAADFALAASELGKGV